MSKIFNLVVLPGDGIGPELMDQARRVLYIIGECAGVGFQCKELLVGGAAIDEYGTALPDETLEEARAADAVLFVAVGGPKWDSTDPAAPRPEQGLLGLRKGLSLYANLRPVKLFDALLNDSTIKPEVLRGVDLVIVRELTGGIYFGKRDREGDMAYDTMEYHKFEVERIVRVACELARVRGTTNVCSVDKANVLEASRLWREIAHKTVAGYPEIELWDQLVDNTAQQIVKNPRQFNVITTGNMFGDIISDEAAMLTSSLGLLPSASLGDTSLGMYEPCHGSYPKAEGKSVANPLAMILCVAMMLRHSLDMPREAAIVESAVEQTLAAGYRTHDMMSDFKDMEPGEVVNHLGTTVGECTLVSTSEMGDAVCERLSVIDSETVAAIDAATGASAPSDASGAGASSDQPTLAEDHVNK